MKKKLTLDQTWTLCLRMWKWIAEQAKKDLQFDVDILKIKWLNKHKQYLGMAGGCFFCEYDRTNGAGVCKECPAQKVNPKFKCDNVAYYYLSRPVAFYNKLVKLNKKRLSEKRNKR